ncbi:hypothetical protein [Natrinema sp. DC36]|uniref:hypothetical protein n=1 Tax=Natrinema sp. DC36 TaxID=2878680 RepID=UPI001CF0371B|nr:hypothetical protein [Natrinema sp. DC36]
MARLSRDVVELTESQRLGRSSVRDIDSEYDAEYRRRRAAEPPGRPEDGTQPEDL